MTKERTPICLEGLMHYEPFLPSPPMAMEGQAAISNSKPRSDDWQT